MINIVILKMADHVMKPINSRLTLDERKVIQKLLNDGFSCSKISKIIGRGKNVIVVEVRRSGGKEKYNAEEAQKLSNERKNRQTLGLQKRCTPNTIEVKKLLLEGKDIWEIHKITKLDFFNLSKIFKSLGKSGQHVYNTISIILDKLYSIQQQMEILFELIGRKND